LLLVLSKHSVESAWVEHEIERALAKELRTRKNVLFPVRLDDAIKTATSTWAQEIREERTIGDMRRWRDHATYQHELEPGRGNIYGWLTEHAVDLGSSEEPATHWLVVDRTENWAYVAPVLIARAIVRAQDLEGRP